MVDAGTAVVEELTVLEGGAVLEDVTAIEDATVLEGGAVLEDVTVLKGGAVLETGMATGVGFGALAATGSAENAPTIESASVAMTSDAARKLKDVECSGPGFIG